MLVIIRVKLIVEYCSDLFLIRLVFFHIGLSTIADTVCHEAVRQVIISLDNHVITTALANLGIKGEGVVLQGGRHLAADCRLIFFKGFQLRCSNRGPITFLLKSLTLV